MDIDKYELYRYILPLIKSNMYVIVSDSDALIIDPIENTEAFERIKNTGIKAVTAVLTHEHFDHISGVNMLRDLMEEQGGTYKVRTEQALYGVATKGLSGMITPDFSTMSDDEIVEWHRKAMERYKK